MKRRTLVQGAALVPLCFKGVPVVWSADFSGSGEFCSLIEPGITSAYPEFLTEDAIAALKLQRSRRVPDEA